MEEPRDFWVYCRDGSGGPISYNELEIQWAAERFPQYIFYKRNEE